MKNGTKFNLTFEEYRAGARLARLHSLNRPGNIFVRVLPLAGLALLCIYPLARVFGLHLSHTQDVVFLCAVAFCLQFLLPFWETNNDAGDFERSKWEAPVEVAFDQDYIRFARSNGVEVSYPWRYFSLSDESDSVFVLLSPARWFVLPKNIFSETDWQSIRDHVAGTRVEIEAKA